MESFASFGPDLTRKYYTSLKKYDRFCFALQSVTKKVVMPVADVKAYCFSLQRRGQISSSACL
jgi:hypothetical protein